MSIKQFSWTIPFISFLLGYFFINSYYHVDSIATPSFVGLTIDHALLIASEHNLTIRILDNKYDEEIAPGTIIGQTPVAHTSIKPQQIIFLTITQLPPAQKMPDFISKNKTTLESYIISHELSATYYYIDTQTAPSEHCIAQSPTPGSTIHTKTPLIVYIARALNKPLIIPDLRGKKIQDITEQLSQHNILLEVRQNSDSYVQKNIHEALIIDQRPVPGSLIVHTQEKPITMTLSIS